MAFLRPDFGAAISLEQSVESAAAPVIRQDAAFLPHEHRAKVYYECSMSPLSVDFYREGGRYVVKKVQFDYRGIIHRCVIHGPWTFAESDQVESNRNGQGMYELDRSGRVVGLLPYRFDGDGEVAGVDLAARISLRSP